MIDVNQFFENNSPLVPTNIHEHIALSKDGYIIKTIYIEDNLSQSTLTNLIKKQIELAEQHKYILEIKEYCFQMQDFPQICYIKYNCQNKAQSLSKIFENLISKNEDFKQKLSEKLKVMYEYMESRNICHKNLKPSNIIYWNNELWLTDFESLKNNIGNQGLNLSFQQKLDCFPYLCDKFFDIYTSPDYLEKIKNLTLQDYQQQNQYAIQMMRLRLFSDLKFDQNQDTHFYWCQNINQWKQQLGRQKFDDGQLMNFVKQFQCINQSLGTICFQSDIQQSHDANQILFEFKNPDIQQGEQFKYYFNYLKANQQELYKNKIIKVEKDRILISSKTIFSSGIEIIKNYEENSLIVVHYKNIRWDQDKNLIGDNCEITWQLWNKFTKIFVVEQKYVGQFRNSKRNGNGKSTIYAVKFILEYDGEWVDDQKQGKGTETIRFENNLQHGKGKIKTTADIETISYVGNFYRGKRLGVFIYNKKFKSGRIEKKKITYKDYCCFSIQYEEPI